MRAAGAGVVLAAGLSSRFGSDKLRAVLEGKPLLQHVIDAAAAVPLTPLIVVISQLQRSLDWRGARPIVNLDPGRGLSSSLQLALNELSRDASARRVVVLLGDQPRVSAAVVERLLAESSRPIVVPRYAGGTPGNPVVLERAAWPLAAALTGDSGMRQLFAARADLVTYVDVPGSNPDVDTPADLAALDDRPR